MKQCFLTTEPSRIDNIAVSGSALLFKYLRLILSAGGLTKRSLETTCFDTLDGDLRILGSYDETKEKLDQNGLTSLLDKN